MELFTIPRASRRELPTPHVRLETHAPYADAWNELDRLQNAANGLGTVWQIIYLAGVLVWAILLAFSAARKTLDLIAGGLLLAEVLRKVVYVRMKQREFVRWPCPRCHAEWPGTKTQKDSRCAICGLRLHQLFP